MMLNTHRHLAMPFAKLPLNTRNTQSGFEEIQICLTSTWIVIASMVTTIEKRSMRIFCH